MNPALETVLRWVVLGLYFGCLVTLSIYGAHRWYLIWLYRRHRGCDPRPRPSGAPLPGLYPW